jgi:outer membrane protein TolC
MKWSIIVGSLFTILFQVTGQVDSARVLTAEQYYTQVSMYHPLVQQANLLTEAARMEVRIAKGAMDPEFKMKYYDKLLGGTNYFRVWDNELHVPVYFAKVVAGYENNSGVNLNGENFTPPNGLSSLGLYIPLGQGLFTDQRRTAIKQSELMQTYAEAEKIKQINKIILEAMTSYYQWCYQYQKWKAYEDAYVLAVDRANGINERVRAGDLAMIDSVEAQVQVQTVFIQFRQAWLEYANAMLETSTFLWDENQQPLVINDSIQPDIRTFIKVDESFKDSIRYLLDYAQLNHPELIKNRVKLQTLQTDYRLAMDKLKPKLDVSYNIIHKGFFMSDDIFNSGYIPNNHKMGLNLSVPLRMRTETGKYQLMGVKVGQAEYELTQQSREIENQLKSYYNEALIVSEQVRVQQVLVGQVRLLSEGEQDRFTSGESSLFIVNQRDMSLLQAEIKLSEMYYKLAKSKLYLTWSAGKM